ncbi:MAG: Gfo/Idh/MocA family oxidoreductase [Clostridia bacterium]|nr:Gfo/Idh/MocA family oxidoreductase [Clostridia bacterium]
MTKIGIVGIGDISGIYLKNITETFKELQIVAVCDLIKERALNAQKEYGIPKVYDTMYELFEDDSIELVLNLTRPYEHFAVSKAALLAGKNVYSEKPLGASLAEGKELVALAEEKGLMIGGAPDTFLGAGIQTCRKLIDDGVIGDIVGASGAMICHGHETWHHDPEFYYKYGGGPMMDMGPYYITALINLMGGVKSVTGVTKISFPQRTITSQPFAGKIIDVDVPTYITGIMQFNSGAVATLTTTFDVFRSDSHDIEIYGSKGTLYVPDPNCFNGKIRFYDGEAGCEKEFPAVFDYGENSRALGLADMAKALETGRAPRASYNQTFHVLEIMEAFSESSKLGKAVEIKSEFTRQPPMPSDAAHGILD